MGNTRVLPAQTVDALASRLSQTPDLRLPAQLRRQEEAPSVEQKKHYLAQLLLHDPGVFLERHGSSLSDEELAQFQCLRGDYEIDFYLKMLEDQQDRQKQSQTSKNRRLAYMNRLVAEGSYFSEKEMRERQPGLFHQYIGQYRPPEQPQAPGEGCAAGNVLAQSILQQQEELDMRRRQQQEQQRWEEAESESEEEEDGQETGAAPAMDSGGQQRQRQVAVTAGSEQQQAPEMPAAAEGAAEGDKDMEDEHSFVRISEEEQAENAEAFLDIMKQQFLAGQDRHVDYPAIDADAELDDDWATEAQRDAEDAYFGGAD